MILLNTWHTICIINPISYSTCPSKLKFITLITLILTTADIIPAGRLCRSRLAWVVTIMEAATIMAAITAAAITAVVAVAAITAAADLAGHHLAAMAVVAAGIVKNRHGSRRSPQRRSVSFLSASSAGM